MKQSHVKVIHPPPRLPLTRGHILRAAVIGVGGYASGPLVTAVKPPPPALWSNRFGCP